VLLLALVLVLFGVGTAHAEEARSREEPPPESAAEVRTSIENTFSEAAERERISDALHDLLKDQPPFLRDAKLRVNLRTYYERTDNFDDTTQQAWALGGSLGFESGYLWERLALGVTGYTSLPIYAPQGEGGTQLLKQNQDSYSVVGQLYARLRLTDGLVASAYRRELSTPFINRDDSRISPNTFEAYGLAGGWADGEGNTLRYGGGWVAKMKPQNSERFLPMSQVAGAPVDRGVALAGFSWSGRWGSIGAIDYYSDDVINIGYAELSRARAFANGFGLQGSVQLIDQRSTGSNLLTGSSFAGNQVGAQVNLSYAGAVATLAYSNTTRSTGMQSPWGNYPGYTSVQVEDFDRAGEQAFLLQCSYSLSNLRLLGVSVYALFVHGWGVSSATGPNQDEFDLDLRWHPPSVKGLWFRARFGMVNQRGAGSEGTTLDDYRLILNYDFAAL
jgi:hypothetical protein